MQAWVPQEFSWVTVPRKIYKRRLVGQTAASAVTVGPKVVTDTLYLPPFLPPILESPHPQLARLLG